MNLVQAVASGILQGITEFLPVSSSGHLVILHHWFGIQQPQIIFDIFLHIGTLCAVVIFFWKDVVGFFTTNKRLGLLIIAACIPTASIGLIFGNFFEGLFGNVKATGLLLVVTGIWLMAGNWAARKQYFQLPAVSHQLSAKEVKPKVEGRELKADDEIQVTCLTDRQARNGLRLWQALLIGLAQGIAIMPGISRSGATISTGLLCGLDKGMAIRFSFLLFIPAILGALVVKCPQIGPAFNLTTAPAVVVGAVVSCVVGLASIKFLMALIGKVRFYIFGIYCVVLGLALVLL